MIISCGKIIIWFVKDNDLLLAPIVAIRDDKSIASLDILSSWKNIC